MQSKDFLVKVMISLKIITTSWTDTLIRLGFEVSTGTVVPFRAEQVPIV